jgi:hypothetical protein
MGQFPRFGFFRPKVEKQSNIAAAISLDEPTARQILSLGDQLVGLLTKVEQKSEQIDRLLAKVDEKSNEFKNFPKSVYKLLWLVIVAPLVWFLVLFLAVQFSGVFNHLSEYTIWAIGSFGLVISTMAVLWIASKSLATGIEDLEERYGQTTERIEKDVRKYIDPSVTFKAKENELRAVLLEELIAFEKIRADKQITIIGADRLRPSRAELEEMRISAASTPLKPEDDVKFRYGTKFNELLARGSGKTLRRYIYLPKTARELDNRTENYRSEFAGWLSEQEHFLMQNPEYTIVNTPRAPMYGAPKSVIFFHGMLVEVFFKKGDGGFIITSRSNDEQSVIKQTWRSLIEGYLAVTDDNAPEQIHYNQGTLEEFRKYKDNMSAELNP